MVAVGGKLPTVTLTVADELWFVLVVTVSLAVKVRTVLETYVWDGLAAVDVWLSPKSHK